MKSIVGRSQYGSAVADLLRADANELGPGSPNRSVENRLRRLTLAELFGGRPIIDDSMARACLAGLWLLHDFLDESHAISQEIATSTGSFWHGIMHRREPDYGNSKYWFRRVGEHPVFVPLLKQIQEDPARQFGHVQLSGLRAKSSWDPFLFVDLCEQALRVGGAFEESCRAVAQLEWQLLFDECFHRAATTRPR